MFLRLLLNGYFVAGSLSIIMVALFAEKRMRLALSGHGNSFRGARRFSVSKNWFALFYMIGIAASVGVLPFARIVDWLFLIHLTRRLLETVIWPYSFDSRMNLLHLAVGLTYYPMLTLAIFRAKFQAPSILAFWLPLWAIQSLSHYRLAEYKEHHGNHCADMKVLRWPFQLSDMPHYWCEVIMYWVLAVSASLESALVFNALFVSCNLAISAWTKKSK